MKDKFFYRYNTLLDALSEDDCGRVPLVGIGDISRYIHLHDLYETNSHLKIILLGKEFLDMEYSKFRDYCSNLNWGDENFLDASEIKRIYDLGGGNLLLELEFYAISDWKMYLDRYNPTEYAMMEKEFSLLTFKLLSEYVRRN